MDVTRSHVTPAEFEQHFIVHPIVDGCGISEPSHQVTDTPVMNNWFRMAR